jgi:hypothetical protein
VRKHRKEFLRALRASVVNTCTSAQAQSGIGREVGFGEFACKVSRIGGGGDHGSVVGGKLARREVDGETFFVRGVLEGGAEFAIGSDASSDKEGRHVVLACGRERFVDEVVHHGALERGDEIECDGVAERKVVARRELRAAAECATALLDAAFHVVGFEIAQDGGLDAAVGEVHAVAVVAIAVLGIAVTVLDLAERKLHGLRIAVLREEVDDRATGVAECEQLGYLIEGLAGSVVAGVSHIVVRPGIAVAFGEIEVGVTPADHQREHGEL